jgi:hypothetical protein
LKSISAFAGDVAKFVGMLLPRSAQCRFMKPITLFTRTGVDLFLEDLNVEPHINALIVQILEFSLFSIGELTSECLEETALKHGVNWRLGKPSWRCSIW